MAILEVIGKDSGGQALLKGVNQALAESGRAADAANIHFHGMKEGSDGLFGSMKELRSEARSHDRVFNFYGQQLAGLTGIAKGLGSEIAGLGIALGSGMWVVAAVEAVKLVVGHFREVKEEEKKSAEEAAKFSAEVGKVAVEANKVLALTLATTDAERALVKMQAEVASSKASEVHTTALRNMVSAQEKLAKLEEPSKNGNRKLINMQEEEELSKKLAAARAELTITEQAYGDTVRAASIEIVKANQADANKETKSTDDKVKKAKEEYDAYRTMLSNKMQAEVEAAEFSKNLAVDVESAHMKAWDEATEYMKKIAAEQVDIESNKMKAEADAADFMAEHYQKLLKENQQVAQKYLAPLKRSIDTALSGLLDGRLNIKQAWSDLWKGMVTTVVDGLVQMGEERLTKAIAEKMLGASTAESGIVASAAAGGAAAAAASAPFFWWSPDIAIGIGEAMNASIIGAFTPQVALATGTWNVPADMPAMIHRGEGVIPEPIMSSVRSGEATIGGGGTGEVHIHVHTMDVRGVRDFLRSNARHVAEAVGYAVRNGASFQGA